MLVIGDEILFVEPIFLRSKQNPVTQLKQVCVVFRGMVHMAPTLEGALRGVFEKIEARHTPPPQPWERTAGGH